MFDHPGYSPSGKVCSTCTQHHHNCPGHFGHIVLPYPIFNPLFINLLVTVLQINVRACQTGGTVIPTVCMNCHRLRLSPHYIQALLPIKGRQLSRLKTIGTMCSRQGHCQFCMATLLTFKQQGISIVAKPVHAAASVQPVPVPAAAAFASLVRLPDIDLMALYRGCFEHPPLCPGFNPKRSDNHPCNAILSLLLVLPPVSRPAMRTVNLKTGGLCVVLDSNIARMETRLWWRTPSQWSIKTSFSPYIPSRRARTATRCGPATWKCMSAWSA